MPRYFTRASGWIEDEVFAPYPGRVEAVLVSEHIATRTGILDSSGAEIMRAPNPIGFGRNDEW